MVRKKSLGDEKKGAEQRSDASKKPDELMAKLLAGADNSNDVDREILGGTFKPSDTLGKKQ